MTDEYIITLSREEATELARQADEQGYIDDCDYMVDLILEGMQKNAPSKGGGDT